MNRYWVLVSIFVACLAGGLIWSANHYNSKYQEARRQVEEQKSTLTQQSGLISTLQEQDRKNRALVAEQQQREQQLRQQGETYQRTSIKLSTPTQDTRDIIAAAMRCLDAIWQSGHRYQKGGVMLQDFFSQGVAQLGLFDEYQPRQKSEQLMGVLDRINNSGRAQLWFAGQGAHQSWSMKRELLSPAYTTRLSDLPRARVY